MIILATAGVPLLLVAVFAMHGVLLRRRERAAERHVEAIGGSCGFEMAEHSWFADKFAALLGRDPAVRRGRLDTIDLSRLPVSDDSLECLQGLSSLRRLDLASTRVTNAGLARLRGLRGLQELSLFNTQVSDAGVAHLAGLTKLKRLDLGMTEVADAGVGHLGGLAELEELGLGCTQLTDAGIAPLRKTVPELEMTH